MKLRRIMFAVVAIQALSAGVALAGGFPDGTLVGNVMRAMQLMWDLAVRLAA